MLPVCNSVFCALVTRTACVTLAYLFTSFNELPHVTPQQGFPSQYWSNVGQLAMQWSEIVDSQQQEYCWTSISWDSAGFLYTVFGQGYWLCMTGHQPAWKQVMISTIFSFLEPAFRGMGFGLEATRLMMMYGQLKFSFWVKQILFLRSISCFTII